MARMDALLGWRDFSEALFAQSRAVDEVQQYPAYGIAMQAKLADVNASVVTLKSGAATAGIVVNVPDGAVLTADYYGVLDGGQLPLDIEFDVELLGASVLSDPRLESTCGASHGAAERQASHSRSPLLVCCKAGGW